MQVISQSELNTRKKYFVRKLQECVFVYPTDTIYGIGCNALNGQLINWIRDMKGRYEMPFSVIAPSKEWIREFCVVDEEAESWLAKLPGPYTLILKIKEFEEIPHSLTQGKETLGVRIPNHWISDLVKEMGIPLVTTSANRTGQNHLQDIEDLSSDWREDIEFAIDEGELTGTPSTLVHLYKEEVVVQKR